MLAEVRGVQDDAGLDAMQDRLPVEAYEALFLYLAGETYEQLVADREAPEQVDTDDFASALSRAESRTRFVVAEDDLALEAMLNAPLERWRVFLHPTQRRLVERQWNGPVRVLGGAGTGKTAAAMHRARWLARNLPEGRILFTTFARNLATDIENNLRTICSPEEMSRIEVTNLDRWVVRFLRGKRYEFHIEFGRNRVVMGRCGIDIRGRSRKLRLNYRTTEETRRWAANLLAGSDIDDLDGGADDKGIRSLTRGPEPVLERFDTQEEQIEFLVSYLAALQTSGEASRAACIVARTTGERGAIKQHLLARDIEAR